MALNVTGSVFTSNGIGQQNVSTWTFVNEQNLTYLHFLTDTLKHHSYTNLASSHIAIIIAYSYNKNIIAYTNFRLV